MTDADRIDLFRTIAPEFYSKSDAEIQTYFDIYADFISSTAYGTLYDKALCYYTAHQLAILGIVSDEGSESSYITSGGITSEKEGDLQRSYATLSTSDDDAIYNKTYYGKMFLQIRKMCIFSVRTRFS